MKIFAIVVVLVSAVTSSPAHAQDRLPIIDMHLHALGAADQGPPPLAIELGIAAIDEAPFLTGSRSGTSYTATRPDSFA